MKAIRVLMVVWLLIGLTSGSAHSVELAVPFLPQVSLDGSNGDWGHTKNCGPTSVIMVAAHHLGFIPTSQDIVDVDDWFVGRRIWDDDNNGNGYDTSLKDDLRPLVQDFYGFTDIEIRSGSNDLNWIRQEIANRNPVIVGVNIDMDPGLGGHFMVITDINDATITVNDPGHSVANQNHHRTYTLQQFVASWATQGYVSMVIRFNGFGVGLFPDGWIDNQCPSSKPFLDAYLAYGGYSQFGAPWDNGSGDEYVHCWPDNCNAPDSLYVQDFLNDNGRWSQLVYNESKDRVYPVSGEILQYWSNHWDVREDGPPVAPAVWLDLNGCTQEIQAFSWSASLDNPSQISYISRCSANGQLTSGILSESMFSSTDRDRILDLIRAAGTGDDDTTYGGGDPTHIGWPCTEPAVDDSFDPLDWYYGMILNGDMALCHAYGFTSASCGGATIVGAMPYYNSAESESIFFKVTTRPSSPVAYRYLANFGNGIENHLISVVSGKTYTLTFIARAEENSSPYPVPITVALVDQKYHNNGSQCSTSLQGNVSNAVDVTIDGVWRKYVVHLKATQNNSQAYLRFFTGSGSSELQIHDFLMEEMVIARLATPSVIFRQDNHVVWAEILYGQGNNIPGVFGMLPATQAKNVVAFVDGYGVYDTKPFDINGNILTLPNDGLHTKVTFYLINTINTQFWFNIWSWFSVGAKINGSWLDFSEVVNPLPSPVSKVTFYPTNSGYEVKLEYAKDSSRKLIGVFNPPDTTAGSTITMFVDGYGMWSSQDFDFYAGNTFILPTNYSRCTFYLTDSSGIQHWFNLPAWQLKGVQINGGWFKWK